MKQESYSSSSSSSSSSSPTVISPVPVSNSVDDRSGQPDETQANEIPKTNKKETTIERGNPLCSDDPELPEWLQEFRENLVDDEIPLQGGSHASSSHEASLEPTTKRREDLGKHNVHTHFPKDRNCEICKRTKITRAPCRRRKGEAVPRADNFGDLITADHKVLSDNCESRNNHRYAVVVQDLLLNGSRRLIGSPFSSQIHREQKVTISADLPQTTTSFAFKKFMGRRFFFHALQMLASRFSNSLEHFSRQYKRRSFSFFAFIKTCRLMMQLSTTHVVTCQGRDHTVNMRSVCSHAHFSQ